MGIPVVIAENGLGVPDKAAESEAPVLTVAEVVGEMHRTSSALGVIPAAGIQP